MFAITKGEKVHLTMIPQDAEGKPAIVEPGSAKWESSDEAVLKITSDATGLTAVGEALAGGIATVTATADAALEPGVTSEIKAITVIGVQESQATSLKIKCRYMSLTPGYPLPEPPPYPSQGPGFPTPPIFLPPWYPGAPPYPSQGPGFPTFPIFLPPWYPGQPPYPSQGPGFPTPPIYWPGYPGGGGGQQPPYVDNTLPGSQPGIDNSLPGNQPEIDNSLPGSRPRPDQGLPPTATPKK